jgi:hypothetical protein
MEFVGLGIVKLETGKEMLTTRKRHKNQRSNFKDSKS